MRVLSILLAVGAGALASGGCGSDAVREAVSLELAFEVRSADADGDGTVVDQVSIASLPGDPWGEFVAAARTTVGGDPSDIAVEDVRLRLAPASVDVGDLAEVFHGPVSLDLRIEANDHRYDVAEALLDDDTLGTEATLSPRLRYEDILDDDRAAVLNGSFAALFVGQAGTSFRDGDATAILIIDATFVATE